MSQDKESKQNYGVQKQQHLSRSDSVLKNLPNVNKKSPPNHLLQLSLFYGITFKDNISISYTVECWEIAV